MTDTPHPDGSDTSGEGVAVKPLEWTTPRGWPIEAKSVVGRYTIWAGKDLHLGNEWLGEIHHASVDAAKAAAQADYEQRIRSALAPPPSRAEVAAPVEPLWLADLIKRLGYHSEHVVTGAIVLRNPDGPEAASALTRIAGERDEWAAKGQMMADAVGSWMARAEASERYVDELIQHLGKATVRAERAEDIAEKAERERDGYQARVIPAETRVVELEHRVLELEQELADARRGPIDYPPGYPGGFDGPAGAE